MVEKQKKISDNEVICSESRSESFLKFMSACEKAIGKKGTAWRSESNQGKLQNLEKNDFHS